MRTSADFSDNQGRPAFPSRWTFVNLKIAMAIVVSVAALVGLAKADVRHYVFDLNPDMVYDVIVNGQTVLDNAVPCECGDISFQGTASTPVAVDALDSAAIADGEGWGSRNQASPVLQGPFPNPARGPARFRIYMERPVTAYLELISLPSGICLDRWTESLNAGVSEIRTTPGSIDAASGIYALKVRAFDATYVAKFLYVK